jgi:iron transport multicopper oxidase
MGNTGLVNGVYYFYAINAITLNDVPDFPVFIDGSVAQNYPLRYFHGGLTIQRTASLQLSLHSIR